jgi:hypothetical protein
MKTKKIILYSTIFLAMIAMNGCDGFDPIKDKETGKDINFLIVDMNFFKTRMSIKFIDASEGYIITLPAKVTFSGKNSDDIVNFSGEKKALFETSQGQLELTTDPNIKISESKPFEFAVNAEIEGYRQMSKGIIFNQEGIKTIEVYLSKIKDQNEEDLGGTINTGNGDTTFVFGMANTGGLKSAATGSELCDVTYSITLSSILKFKNQSGNLIFNSSQEAINAYNADPANFISLSVYNFSEYLPWIDVLETEEGSRSVIFHLLETGGLSGIQVAGQTVGNLNGGIISSSTQFTGANTPDYFGFNQFNGSANLITGTDTVYTSLGFTYRVASAQNEVLCPSGTTIIFTSTATSSFSITADVYDRQVVPQLITTLHFTGNFPDTFVVENTPPIPVTLLFRDDNVSFQPIASFQINNFCSGTVNVDVSPTSGYQSYQIVLKGFCPDNPGIAVAPTYSGEFRLAGSTNPWQTVTMSGGVVDLLGLPNRQYEYRLLWENDWEYTSLWTEFDAQGNYTHTTDARNISSQYLPDGRIRINIDHDFKQSVCDQMGW